MSVTLLDSVPQGVPLLEAVAAVSGYRFRDVSLLKTALTLPSWYAEAKTGTDNQRLEFFGDAVLGLLAAEHLYAAFPNLDEGDLSILRAQIISGRTLADVAREIGLGTLMRMGRSDEHNGGLCRENALADTLEAVFGAVWLDGGLAAARAVFCRLLTKRICDESSQIVLQIENPKGRLQEQTQAIDGSVPIYELIEAVGPDHQPQYRVRVTLNSGLSASATGSSKRSAEAAAAQAALDACARGEESAATSTPAPETMA